MTEVERARSYVAAADPPTAGERNNAVHSMARRLIQRFDLPDEDLLDLLLDWARRATPPLPDREVRTAFASARRSTAYDPDKAAGRDRGQSRSPARRPAPPKADAPAAPLPTDDELATACALLVTGDTDVARRGREYLQACGIDPAACGWGLARLAAGEVGTFALPEDVAGWRYLVPVRDAGGALRDVRRYRGPFGEGDEATKVLPWAKGYGQAKPYRFDRLDADADPVVWCEGEKDAEAVAAADFAAVAHTCGAGAGAAVARGLPSELVTGRRFVLLFDHDQAGATGAARLAEALIEAGAGEVRIATWPDSLPDGSETPAGFDAADWFAAGYGADELAALIEAAAPYTPEEVPVSPIGDEDELAETDGDGKPKRPSQSTMLLREARAAGVRPFRDPEGGLWLAVPNGDHLVPLPIGERGGGVTLWLTRLYATNHGGSSPSATALADAARGLAAEADVGPVYAVHLRVAPYGDGVVIDLCRDDWRVAVVTPKGWWIAPCPDSVFFRRPRGLRALPDPDPNGSLTALSELLADRMSEEDRILATAWCLAALRPGFPYPVLAVYGEQGSGKSTVCRLLRFLVDPDGEDGRGLVRQPRDEESLAAVATAHHVVALENLSHLPEWLSDGLSALSTGTGWSGRRRYTDYDVAEVYARRPVLLNGIVDVATKPDLLSRFLVVTLDPIPETERRQEAGLWQRAEEAAPAVFGGLLTALSGALRCLPEVPATGWPRMSDFAALVQAAEDAGAVWWPAGRFREVYATNQAGAQTSLLDASPLPALLIELAERQEPDNAGHPKAWKGSPSALLSELASLASEDALKAKAWPANAARLGAVLTQLAPSIRAAGEIDIYSGRNGRERKWTVKLLSKPDGSADGEGTNGKGEGTNGKGDGTTRRGDGAVTAHRKGSVAENSQTQSGFGPNGDGGDGKSVALSLDTLEKEVGRDREGHGAGDRANPQSPLSPQPAHDDWDPFASEELPPWCKLAVARQTDNAPGPDDVGARVNGAVR